MRTHLLRTVYPLLADTEIEPDTGCALNDACYAPDEAPPVKAMLSLVVAAAPASDDDDDYYLGGYAGI